jgi:hypothetical protein
MLYCFYLSLRSRNEPPQSITCSEWSPDADIRLPYSTLLSPCSVIPRISALTFDREAVVRTENRGKRGNKRDNMCGCTLQKAS